MIRYVIAVLLASALLALSGPAIDAAGREVTERDLKRGIADIETAAIELRENEERSPAGHPDPQRVVEVELPRSSFTSVGVSEVTIEPADDARISIARYVLEDGTTNQIVIDERVVYRDATETQPTTLEGTGTRTLYLVLLEDEHGTPIVVIDPPSTDS